ncbi:TetR/AcrR family transcriptional regulator [Bradyrhizobium oligotrophicum]|uniref:TetR/AcrR family transcriptional regulator n=1 Tax=Bradyrhizobium oligotrophicum TaxID=44255 RepID=UPI003EC003C1
MQVKSARRSNPERTAEMRARLVATARRLFVAHGYAATSTPAIVEAAGVTRGALYHHFEDKQAIFRAVIEAESAAVAAAIEAGDTPQRSARKRLLAGAKAYVLAMQADGRTRLLLIEGPAVLGRDAIRAIEARNGDASLKTGLREAIAEGALPRLPLDALASLLSAMFERAATDVSEGMATADVLKVIERILRGLVSD